MTIPLEASALFQDAVDVEVFDSPGTWTWPGANRQVKVLAVGGGGRNNNGGGGGGAVIVRSVPVESPLSVTIGAGAGPTDPAGGTTSVTGTNFLVEAGGGGTGGRAGPSPAPTSPMLQWNGSDAPPIGGGGGGGGYFIPGSIPGQGMFHVGGKGGFGAPGNNAVSNQDYGNPTLNWNIPGNGVRDTTSGGGGGGASGAAFGVNGGAGLYGFGAGGIGSGFANNTSWGTGGSAVSKAGHGGAPTGAPGIVIIGRWK